MIETRVELNQCVLSKPVSELEKSMRPRSIMPPYIVTDLALVWLHPGGLHADASYATAFSRAAYMQPHAAYMHPHAALMQHSCSGYS
jgi:hypothetical protein